MAKDLRSNYEKACNAYVAEFCKKHEFDVRDAEWVGGDVGGVILIADYYISLEDIMTDIEKDVPRGEYWKYYSYSLDCAWLDIRHPNYKNWLAGAPVKSKETLDRLKTLKKAVMDAEYIFRCELEKEY